MRERFAIDPQETQPDTREVLKSQGVPPRQDPGPRISQLLTRAFSLLQDLVAPAGLLQEVSQGDFAEIYRGQGQNAPQTPLGSLFPRAERLALFAVTLGEGVSRRINELIEDREFALGALLDAAASEAAEKAATAVENRYFGSIADGSLLTTGAVPVRYSPGYCGWHVSGQKALFGCLHPEEIGMTLRESCLMEPLKSISGVIVSALPDIHDFADDFPFCDECTDRGCRARIRNAVARSRRSRASDS